MAAKVGEFVVAPAPDVEDEASRLRLHPRRGGFVVELSIAHCGLQSALDAGNQREGGVVAGHQAVAVLLGVDLEGRGWMVGGGLEPPAGSDVSSCAKRMSNPGDECWRWDSNPHGHTVRGF